MEITVPAPDRAEAVADLWVALAADQRDHGSHILPSENRSTIHEAVHRHLVADELLVARDEDALVGFVMFTVESGRFDQDVTRGLVENIYVVPGYRGQEIGTDLLEAAESGLRERGVDVVALDVMADNEAARRFYRRNGYDAHRVQLEKSAESDTL